MRKTQAILIFVGIVFSITSLLLLCFAFNYSFYDLIENALVAVFTGCIFATPTVLMQLYLQKQKVYEDIVGILEKVEKYLQVIRSKCESAYEKGNLNERTAVILANRALSALNNNINALGNILNESLESPDKISKLMQHLYELSSCYTRVLSKEEPWISAKSKVEDLNSTCIAIIEEFSRSQ